MINPKEEFYVRKRKGKLSDHLELKTDGWSCGSKNKLKASVKHKMKRIYVGILDLLDNEVGRGNLSEETLNRLRKNVLNLSNNQIRNIELELDERYNIEALNYHIEFKVVQPEEDSHAG